MKRPPFPAKFKVGPDKKPGFTITDPMQVYEAFEKAESMPSIHTIVIDSLTFLLDLYETRYVLTASNGMKAWSDFAQYFKRLMQYYVANSSKNVIFTAHVQAILNEADMLLEKKIPVKGSLQKNSIEAYFSSIVSARTISIDKLTDYSNDLLTITEEDQITGLKYVFQTRLTKETVNERIRSPMGMWAINETFIDNDAQLLLDRLITYYQ